MSFTAENEVTDIDRPFLVCNVTAVKLRLMVGTWPGPILTSNVHDAKSFRLKIFALERFISHFAPKSVTSRSLWILLYTRKTADSGSAGFQLVDAAATTGKSPLKEIDMSSFPS